MFYKQIKSSTGKGLFREVFKDGVSKEEALSWREQLINSESLNPGQRLCFGIAVQICSTARGSLFRSGGNSV